MKILRRVPTIVILVLDILLTIVFMAHKMHENRAAMEANPEYYKEVVEWLNQ